MKPSPSQGVLAFFVTLMLWSCSNKTAEKEPWPQRSLSSDFKQYWFSGEAEISSYDLKQSRYGEQRAGTAVLVYVTEDFLPKVQVKANSHETTHSSVLKLNATKNFLTGIYPYSIMQSTFYPLEENSHALKVSASVQEWCGQVYMQLNNRKDFEIQSHSYFEGEADEKFTLNKAYLENEIWTQLRVDPEQLPVGEVEMIPSLEYIRLAHVEMKAYQATAEFYLDGELSVYKISYPELKRTLKIYYIHRFPFPIEKWEEIIETNDERHVTSAIKMADIKSAYWNKNSNNDLPLRDELNLN